MRFIIFYILFFVQLNCLISQVSIGNSDSIPNVILNLSNNDDRGLQLSFNSSINSIPGLLFFNITEKKVEFSLNGSLTNFSSIWNYDISTKNIYFNGTNIGIGLSTPTHKLSISNGDAVSLSSNNAFLLLGDKTSQHLVFDDDEVLSKTNTSSAGTLELQKFGGDVDVNGKIKQNSFDLLPAGSVVMYSGSVSGNYPIINGAQNTNWHICNGNNSTPDLRNKFIVGSGSSYSLNDTGGQSSSTHTHSFNPSNKLTTNSPSHSHSFGSASGSGRVGECIYFSDGLDGANKSHSHSSWSSDSHSHSANLPSKTSTGPSDTENRPLFHSLFYMIKL
jgi:hypothetical protein